MAKSKIQLNAEREYVVEPLKYWFEKQEIKWDVKLPQNATSEIGWDLETRRKNLDLLIEAKYIQRSFISSFSQLVTSPLTKRAQRFMKRKGKSWCAHPCWAIGTSYKTRNIYQLIFDYFVRNPTFWKHYHEDLNLKYVFFVIDGKVAKITFKRLLGLAETYTYKTSGKKTAERREVAEKLMRNLIFT